MSLIAIGDLSPRDVEAIWALASASDVALSGTVAWSFEGNGIRTRTTFIQAFRDLGLQFTELPNLRKTGERGEDLAGYLDPFFSLYVVRESDHERLAAFARASSRPVINAMSRRGHPCEVLTDAYFIDRWLKPLREATVCLWGPTTNVFRSWHELAAVLDLRVVQVCDERYHEPGTAVRFLCEAPAQADVVITDAWPAEPLGVPVPLEDAHLVRMGSSALLPTPPFKVGGELLLDPLRYTGFVGYRQKELLLPVQKAIIRHVLDQSSRSAR
jgi:ornithine carbamoyltransferase